MYFLQRIFSKDEKRFRTKEINSKFTDNKIALG